MIADVAVPITGIDDALSYAVPRMLEGRVQAGARVLVSVGNRRVVGLIMQLRPVDAEPGAQKLKPLQELIDEAPVVSAAQLALARFVSSYYAADLGACVRLVLPPDTASGVERRYQLSEQGEQARALFGPGGQELGRAERIMLEGFQPGERKAERKIARTASQTQRLAELVRRGFIEEVTPERAVGKVRHEEKLIARDDGAPLPPRSPALAGFDAWLRAFTKAEGRPPTMGEASAAHDSARGKVKKLAALGRLRVDSSAVLVSRAGATGIGQKGMAAELTEAQSHAVARVEAALAAGQGGAFLLEGVTGSGKTEVYLRALRAALGAGRGAILVVPEIGLTPQLVGRVQAALADRADEVVVLHSGVTIPERRDALARLRDGSARVAVGARSALFAPVLHLGLVIIDEEHDASLKQDETPRYHGRDVALWRAKQEGAVCVLGSATPSLESRHNVELGKLELLELPARVGGGGTLPSVEVIDLRARSGVGQAKKRDRQNADEGPGVVLSGPLVTAMGEVLAAGDQVLLFLNKRGYASAMLCEMCGHIEQCPHCSVSLTLHRRQNVLVCHQCDHERPRPTTCSACGHDELLALGLGTERLESEVAARFPDARVCRLDRDAVKHKGALESTLARIHAKEVDIVVGTQMIAKGHDFPGVRLVGVVLADIALAMPDFRAGERAFALLAQVAGRAGRGAERGRVLIQTYKPEAPPIAFAVEHDVKGYAALELAERRLYRYPPFTRAALVRVEAEDAERVPALAAEVAGVLGQAVKSVGEGSVLGPAPCAFERLQGRTRWQVFLRTQTVSARAAIIDALRREARGGPLGRDLQRAHARLILDLDPLHML